MTNLLFPVAYRPYDETTDAGLVLDSWCRQARSMEPLRSLDPQGWAHHREMMAAVARGVGSTVVACHPEHPSQIFGYCVGWKEPQATLCSLYVRSAWRRMGVASGLLAQIYGSEHIGTRPIYLTHQTKSSRHHRDRWCLVVNPYLFPGSLTLNPENKA